MRSFSTMSPKTVSSCRRRPLVRVASNFSTPPTRKSSENSFVFACPASDDRYYAVNNRDDDDPTGVQFRIVQFDFTRTGDLVDTPAFNFITTGLANDLPVTVLGDGTFFPDEMVYDLNYLSPFAVRFNTADDERLILFGTGAPAGGSFAIQSLRMPTGGTVVSSSRQEGTPDAEVCAIVFAPPGEDRAFAITRTGVLLERDFTDPAGTFVVVSQFALAAGDAYPRLLVPVRWPELRLFALSQTRLERYDDEGQPMSIVFEIANPESERLMSLASRLSTSPGERCSSERRERRSPTSASTSGRSPTPR